LACVSFPIILYAYVADGGGGNDFSVVEFFEAMALFRVPTAVLWGLAPPLGLMCVWLTWVFKKRGAEALREPMDGRKQYTGSDIN
jgi:hypothetical protein